MYSIFWNVIIIKYLAIDINSSTNGSILEMYILRKVPDYCILWDISQDSSKIYCLAAITLLQNVFFKHNSVS